MEWLCWCKKLVQILWQHCCCRSLLLQSTQQQLIPSCRFLHTAPKKNGKALAFSLLNPSLCNIVCLQHSSFCSSCTYCKNCCCCRRSSICWSATSSAIVAGAQLRLRGLTLEGGHHQIVELNVFAVKDGPPVPAHPLRHTHERCMQ